MTTDQLNRTIDACRRAGLPVVDERDCTCGLRGRLVVLARPDGPESSGPTTAAARPRPAGPRGTPAGRATPTQAVPFAGRAVRRRRPKRGGR